MATALAGDPSGDVAIEERVKDSNGQTADPAAPTSLPGQSDTAEPVVTTQGQQSARVGIESSQEAAPDPHVLNEIDKFQRMEACLYKHRKEWEQKAGPGKWRMRYYPEGEKRMQYRIIGDEARWMTAHMNIRGEREYSRPDIFDPASLRDIDANDYLDGHDAKDAYDTTINWGNRRDRLRKNFEWELDRMFLLEELQLKKLEQQKSDEGKKRRERRMAEWQAEPGQDHGLEAALLDNPSFTGPNIALLEWYDFRKPDSSEGTTTNTIDVLIGEPVVDTDNNINRFRFRRSGHHVKSKYFPSTGRGIVEPLDPATSPLPERIRINSDVLLELVGRMLGSNARKLLELEEMSAVFTRPFKALAYLEQDLRDWCLHLQEKFEGPSSASEAVSAGEASSIGGQQQSDAPSISSQSVELNKKNATVDLPVNVQTINVTPTKHSRLERTQNTDAPDSHPLDAENELDTGYQGYDDFDDGTNALIKSPTALKHLKCLLQCLEISLVAKRNYIESPICRKIFFSDLWQLFRPGTEVIGSDGKQAYRVIGVESAKHRIAPSWERWYKPRGSEEDKTPDFRVTCVYIDFDGVKIGPVQKWFEFDRFDGQREITSLEVYPISFQTVRHSEFSDVEWRGIKDQPVSEWYRKKLVGRGERFLEVIRGKHMYYAGSTLDEKEEAESPVVIDFETAITAHDSEIEPLREQHLLTEEQKRLFAEKAWKPKMSTLIGMPGKDPETERNECIGECCRDDYVYDDQHVDAKQREEYIASLLPGKDAVDEQPPITIMPRPLRDLTLGNDGNFQCSDDELVIMSYRAFGFVLRSRKFGTSSR